MIRKSTWNKKSLRVGPHYRWKIKESFKDAMKDRKSKVEEVLEGADGEGGGGVIVTNLPQSY